MCGWEVEVRAPLLRGGAGDLGATLSPTIAAHATLAPQRAPRAVGTHQHATGAAAAARNAQTPGNGERTRCEARYQRQTRMWRRGEEMRQSGWQRLRLLLAEAVVPGFHPFPFAGIRTAGLLMYARLYLLARVLRDFSRLYRMLYRARAQLAEHSTRSIPTRNFGWRLAAKAW